MSKRLVITEKPSVARDIAAALGGFTDHEDHLESDDFVVTWAVGHLLELAEPQDYDKKFGSWSIKNLPIIPEQFQIKPREGQKKRLDAIRKLGRRKDVEGLINACDAGREGELIYRRIVEYTGLDHLPQQRLWLSSMTKNAIRTAFDRLRPGEELDPLADAAWTRAVGDWLVGMNATRALTQRLKSRGERDPWSAGRVQTPTLNLIVARERQILAHVPRPYWEIQGDFSHKEQRWTARYWDPEQKPPKEEDDEGDPDAKPSRIFERERVELLMAGLTGAKTGVANEKRKKSKQSPPLPFDLTTMQREANKRFGFSARRTLDAAQRLYEAHKLLTYPRTDSRYLPSDYGPHIVEVLKGLQKATDWRDLGKEIEQAPQNLDRLLDDTKVSDHFAIIPTGAVPEGPLRGDDERIFELAVRQFLAALMGPATWSNVERIVEVPVPGETARFRVTARSLEDPGFHRALGTSQEANALPALVPGQDTSSGVEVAVEKIEEEAKETKPPSRYSEAQMLRMMETAGERVEEEELSGAMRGRGLGTPATRAETMEGLVRKGYARRVENKLAPTSKAMRLMDILERLDVGALASPQLTGEWEYMLQEVQAGRLKRAEVLERLEKFTRDMTGALSTFEHENLYAGDPDLGECPACHQGRVVETAWGYRCTRNTASDSDCDLIIWKDRAGRYIDRKTAMTLVEHGKAGPLTGFVDRGGRSLEGTLHLERDPEKERWTLRVEYGGDGPGAEGPEIVGEPIGPCPAHEGCQIVETDRRYVCRKLLEGEVRTGPVLPKVVCHREMSVEEAMTFFSEPARTEFIEGFVSKRGRPFTGALIRKETGKHGFEFPPRAGAVDAEGKPVPRGKAAKGRRAAKGDGEEAVASAASAAKATPKGAKAKTTRAKAPAKAAPAKAKATAAKTATKAPGKTAAGKATAAKRKAAAPAPPPAPPRPKSKGAAKKTSRKAAKALAKPVEAPAEP